MSQDPALQTLIVESRELLQNMEDSLLQIENEADKSESINAIFGPPIPSKVRQDCLAWTILSALPMW